MIWKTPYYKVVFDKNLKERLELITAFEDRFFWKRKKTYTFVSVEHIVAWYCDKQDGDGRVRKRRKIRFRVIFHPSCWRYVLKRCSMNINQKFSLIKDHLSRGHSTIPMQLIRILSYKHGLVFDITKVPFKKYKILKRKIYEVLYAHMFFEGLRKYLSVELCHDMEHYHEYLVYLYPQIVQTKIEGKVYAPAKMIFSDGNNKEIIPMNEWDIHRTIEMCFGFNGRAITENRIREKQDIIGDYNFKI